VKSTVQQQITRNIFYILDVFAERKYAGNQLAVVRGGSALSSDAMQQIAREINFSETTFILADTPRDGGFDVRIFTPREEVPFAGHPTLGTAHVIRTQLQGGAAEQVVLNLKVGQIPVTFGQDGYQPGCSRFSPTFGQQHAAATLAAVLGLDVDDIDARFPIQEVSTGLPFFIIPLKQLAALQRAKVQQERYFDLIRDTVAKGLLIFCPEPHAAPNDISVRVFVDYFGVPEDPATGSANGCLAGYLVKHRYFGRDQIDIRSEQGYEIGRPSLLLLRAAQHDAGIDIQVGGQSILVAQGELL
jgi:trans-2,3-dihydro-3-hydroxyanthranilate isomerase